MKIKRLTYLFCALFLLIPSFIISSYSQNENDENFAGLVKVALRNTGNSLLLQNNDSTSLVLPVIETDKNHFKLSFQTELSIVPDSLVKAVGTNLAALNLSRNILWKLLIVVIKKCLTAIPYLTARKKISSLAWDEISH